jgi:hypothetical protein
LRCPLTLDGFERNKCIFVHIPKCAGKSISQSLFGNQGFAHTNAREYRIIFGNKFDKIYKFTIVRNPWDRLVSAFYYLKSGGYNKKDKKWYNKHISKYGDFNEFVREWLNEKNIYRGIHFYPQRYFLCDDGHKLLVDYIGKFEKLDYEFNYLKNKLNIKSNLQHINSSKRKYKDYRKFYNDETQDIVAKVYDKDIKLFDYNF